MMPCAPNLPHKHALPICHTNNLTWHQALVQMINVHEDVSATPRPCQPGLPTKHVEGVEHGSSYTKKYNHTSTSYVLRQHPNGLLGRLSQCMLTEQ